MKTQRLRVGKWLLQCPMATGRWNWNIRFQAGLCSITLKCPPWYPFIILRARSTENTDLENKAYNLPWLWASSSTSLGLSFLFCTVGYWSLRVFPAHTAGGLRAAHSIAPISPLGGAVGSPPSQSCSFERNSHSGPQPASGKHSQHPLEHSCSPRQLHRKVVEL